MLNVEALRAEFPISAQVAYLNHAAACPIPLRAARAMEAIARDQAAYGMLREKEWAASIAAARSAAGALLGDPRPDRVSFVRNTSEGLSIAANGLDWRPGDNVVLPEAEFPSNTYPWMNLERLGVKVRRVRSTGPGARFEDLADAVDGRTRVLAVSAVQFSSGYRYDLAALAALCGDRGALFVVDAIQALGALRLDPVGQGVDVLAAGAHKWLLGPFGTGLTWFSDRALAQLRPPVAGWLSVESPYTFHYRFDWLPGARRFEPGTENVAGLCGLGASIGLLLELGPDAIEARVLALTDRLIDGARRRGWTVLTDTAGARRSGIVVVGNPSVDMTAARARQEQAGVFCSIRGGGLRFSPHAYNTEDEIDRAVDALA